MTTDVLRALVIGVVTGGRSFTGLAAVALTASPDSPSKAVRLMAGRRGRATLAFAAIGEIANDKNPRIPGRVSPIPLASRLVTGGLAGAALASRDRTPIAASAAAGVVGALIGSYAGWAWRGWAGRTPASAFASAVAEDAATLALALVAITRVPPTASPNR